MRFSRFAFALSPLALVACAQGGTVESTYMNGTGGFGGTSSMHSSSHSASSGRMVTSSTTDVSTGVGGSGGDTSVSSSTTTSSSSGGMCSYEAPEMCDTAELLAAIDGDQNMDVRLASGTTSKWYKIYIREAVSSIISYPQLSYTATLENPPGMHFDLYSYVGDSSNPSCAGNPLEGVGSPLTITETWGDNKGSDDSLWFVFEVRYVSGSVCDASSKWKLSIAGHTVP
jgi:hypothetical protein